MISAATAARMIAKWGRDVTLVTESRTAGDVTKPWDGPTAPPSTSTIKMFSYDYETEEIDGTLVKMGDKRGLVAGNVSGIAQGDKIQDSSITWQIAGSKVIEKNTSVILYDLTLRK